MTVQVRPLRQTDLRDTFSSGALGAPRLPLTKLLKTDPDLARAVAELLKDAPVASVSVTVKAEGERSAAAILNTGNMSTGDLYRT